MSSYAGIHTEGDRDLARPWPRFWARIVDLILYGYVAAFAVGLAMPATFTAIAEQPAGPLAVALLLIPFALVLDAMVLALTGASPGKWLAGLRLEQADGGRPHLEGTLRRNLLLWVRGMWLGIPLLNIIGFLQGFNDVKSSGRTSWDDSSGMRVTGPASNEMRTIFTAIVAIALRAADQALSRL